LIIDSLNIDRLGDEMQNSSYMIFRKHKRVPCPTVAFLFESNDESPFLLVNQLVRRNTFIGNVYRLDVAFLVEIHAVDTDDPVIGIGFAKRSSMIDDIPFVC
jgi:hypothetical protein